MSGTTTPSLQAAPARHRSQRHAAAHVAQYIHELSDRHARARRAMPALGRPAPRVAVARACTAC